MSLNIILRLLLLFEWSLKHVDLLEVFILNKCILFIYKNNETRHVTHLQYTAWPDHGTPTPLELLVFYHYVSRAKDIHPENKLLVHCRYALIFLQKKSILAVSTIKNFQTLELLLVFLCLNVLRNMYWH